MRAGMQKVFALQINLRATGVCSQPLRVKQRRWSASVIAQQQVEFAPEIIVVSRARELCRSAPRAARPMFPERSGHRIYPSVRVRPAHLLVIINGAVMLATRRMRSMTSEASLVSQ